jgi:outer membrane protein
MKKTKFYLLIALFAVSPLSASANTLLDIYQLALENDSQLKADRAAYEAGLENRYLGRANLLPQINATGNYTDNSTDITGSADPSLPGERSGTIDRTQTGWGVSLDQPLFNMSSWYTYKQGVKLSNQAEAQFGADQQNLIVRVAEAYFNVLRAVDTLEATIAEENALSHQLEQAKQRYEVGLTAITEVHEAQAAYDSALAFRLQARGNLIIAYEALGVLTGQSHDRVAPLSAEFPVVDPVPADRHEWVEFSLKNNYALKAARLRAEAFHETARASRAGHLPTVSASLAYNDTEEDGKQFGVPIDSTSDGTSVGIRLNVPLFSGGRTSSRSRQAYAEFTRAQEEFNSTQRNTIQSSRALHLSVETGVAQVQARKQAIVSSQSALEATQSGYEVGTRNLVEVLLAQRQLYQARRDYATALYDYVINTIRLREVAGMLTPGDVQEIDKWLQAQAPVNRSQYE